MPAITIEKIVSAIHTATSPVILISGVGLLLLTMTNRLGRSIDRIRALSSSSTADEPAVRAQIDVLLVRARLLRNSILCAVGGALSSSFLIMVIFWMLLNDMAFGGWVGALFILSMGFISASLVLFAMDVNLSLSALKKKLNH